ncbi:MAG: hypothetical protein U0441_22575 [Polyangiaceae bacterium]
MSRPRPKRRRRLPHRHVGAFADEVAMSHRLKVTIKNESAYVLTAADNVEETVLKAPSILSTGSNPLPKSIPAKPAPPAQPMGDNATGTAAAPASSPSTGSGPQPSAASTKPATSSPPKNEVDFTIETPIDGPTPDGYIVLQFDALQLRVALSWTDYSALNDGDGSIANPCTWTEERPDGSAGEVDVTIEYFDKDKKPVEFDKLEEVDAKIKQRQQELVTKGFKDVRKFPAVPMYPVEVVFTVNVRVPATIGTAPAMVTAVMPPVAARPAGSGRIVTGGQFPTWDTPGLSRRRKKLLAAIGSCFPMHYSPKAGDLELQSKDASIPEDIYNDPPTYAGNAASRIPYLSLRGWSPGMTSCTHVSTMLEGLLTGRQGKWGFAAPFIEDAWVPWGANPIKPMPNVGDIYLLFDDNASNDNDPHLRHIGFILHVPKDTSEKWVTAEGGQLGISNRSGEHGGAAYLNVKPWVKRIPVESANVKADKTSWEKKVNTLLYAKPIVDLAYPYMIGGYESTDAQNAGRMIGWLDLDSPAFTFLSEEFDGPIDVSRLWNPDREVQQRVKGVENNDQRCTEADFRFLGAWINKMLRLPNNLEDWIAHIKDPANNAAPARPVSTWGQEC